MEWWVLPVYGWPGRKHARVRVVCARTCVRACMCVCLYFSVYIDLHRRYTRCILDVNKQIQRIKNVTLLKKQKYLTTLTKRNHALWLADAVFDVPGVAVVWQAVLRTLFCGSKCNSYMERWVKTKLNKDWSMQIANCARTAHHICAVRCCFRPANNAACFFGGVSVWFALHVLII